MKKYKDILIFIFALIIVSAIAYIVFLSFDIQNRYEETPMEKIEVVTSSDSDV